jgi:hypothetical protein
LAEPELGPPSARGFGRNPRLILTVGLYGSASTWLYNVVRELLIAEHGEARVCATYSETVAGVIENRNAFGKYVVWKMHCGDAAWDVFADLARPTILLTVRDPRDAILSLVERFNTRVEVAANAVSRCCARALQCAEAGHPVLRYEDRFVDDPRLVRSIADYIGATVSEPVIAAVFARYTPDAVRCFAARIETLPADRQQGDDPTIDIFDRITQIHRGHIGDQRIGKWRERLNSEQQQKLAALFLPFLHRFGYD